VFSKAWVLSLLVKAVEAVREQQSKIETLNCSEGSVHVGERDMEKSELNIEDRQNVVSNMTIQPDSGTDTGTCNRGDSQIMGMESLECDQTDNIRDRPMCLQDTSSKPEQSDSLAEASNRDTRTQPWARIEDGKEVEIGRNVDENSSTQRTEREGEEEREGELRRDREGERGGGDRESDGGEGDDDGLVERRDRSSLLGGVEDVSESLENDLCRLWDASMNMVCLLESVHVHVSIATHMYCHKMWHRYELLLLCGVHLMHLYCT
jgi:hypothetical protein